MNSARCWKRELQVAALAVALLLSACQSHGFAPQPNTGMWQAIAPAQMTGQRLRGLVAGQRILPCNGASTTPAADGTPLPFYIARARTASTFSPRLDTAYLYIADEYNNQIDIFPAKGRNQPQLGTITSGIDQPYGIWFDRGTKSLYVANQTNNTVTVYPYGSIQPTRTYSQDLDRPLYPMVDRHGDLFVSNANTGAVVEYLAGSTKVHHVLQTPGIEADGMAFDKQENLYVAYRTCPSGSGSIDKFAPGSIHGDVIGMTLSDPQGVAVDSRGNVVVDETGTANNRLTRIDVFPPGSKTASHVVPMPQGDLPIELMLDCDENTLYVSGLYDIVFGATYPLVGQNLFVKDQVSAVVQGVTTTNNLEL